VSTARDVGLDHIKKWREKFWIIGFYKVRGRGPELQYSLCLTPSDLAPWIASLEAKIKPDFELAERASQLLTVDDLYTICGNKTAYDVLDAKLLHKNQWSAKEYLDARDITVRTAAGTAKMISPARMLEILRLRARYIAERGATLNNPHISKRFLDTFATAQVTSNQAATIRTVAQTYILSTPKHPFPQTP